MSNYQLAKRAVRLFTSEYVDKPINRANQRRWLIAVKALGNKWKFIDHVQRKEAL